MDPVAILIPAAGFGTRMRGADKLLQDVGGLPLIRRQAQRALAAGDHVVVTLPSTDSPRAQALSGLPIRMVEVPDAADLLNDSPAQTAITRLERLLENEGRTASARDRFRIKANLGSAHFAKGDKDAAVDWYRQAHDEYPDTSETRRPRPGQPQRRFHHPPVRDDHVLGRKPEHQPAC